MFTGIIETTGLVTDLVTEGLNLHIAISSSISDALHVDQSVSHNGVCLTVTRVESGTHYVTAIAETLRRTQLGSIQKGDALNLERCLPANGRLDGHIVQGHVDTTALVESITEEGGSWLIRFRFEDGTSGGQLTDKGSIAVNGVSLTVVSPTNEGFGVAIIPYTWEHTGFHTYRVGDRVNIEFDIIGKYVFRWMEVYGKRP